MFMHQNHYNQKWNHILVRAWSDDEFKNRLLGDPAAVFKENGLDLPLGKQVKIVENTDQVFHLTLPHRPTGELVEEELGQPAQDVAVCFCARCGGCGWCGGCAAG